MNQPQFSVIIPTLNEEKFLPRLLESLATQTDKNFELIIVDGLSKDKTKDAALALKKKLPQLKFIDAPKAGVSLQRNLGAKASHGRYLVFIDADGVVLPYFIERLGNFIASHENPELFTSWFQADSETTEDAMAALIGNLIVEGALFLKRPWAPGPLTIVRRDAFDLVHGYDETITFGEDHDIAMRLFEKGIKLQVIREVLYVYSLRRLRKEGKLRVLPQYLRAILSVIITKHGPKHMPGYITGGQLYNEKRHKKGRSSDKMLRQFKSVFKKLVKEFFA